MENSGFFTPFHGKTAKMDWSIMSVQAMVLAAVFAFSGGCDEQKTTCDCVHDAKCPTSTAKCKKESKNAVPDTSKFKQIGPPLADLEDRTVWDTCFIAGHKVGYSKTTVSHTTLDQNDVVKIESLSRLSVQRFSQLVEMAIELINYQTTDGRLISFESRVTSGEIPLVAKGRVKDGTLVTAVVSKGMQQTTSIAWSNHNAAMFGVEQMLLGDPMKPGQRRSICTLMPIINQLAVTYLTARDYELVQVPSGTYQLLRIDTTAVFDDGQKMQGTIWTDSRGDTLKVYSAAARQEMIRTTEADALDETDLGKIDLGTDMQIPVNRPLNSEELTQRARYRIHLKGGDPASLLVESASQHIQPTEPDTAVVTVYALRPDSAEANPQAPKDIPGRGDIEPNNLVQSDDPTIVSMAAEAAGDLQDPWPVAVALEKYVYEHIAKKDFSDAFATAAEVAESRQGDCTEHAVLLAALARACGIPARAAIGLVYMPDEESFFYHMWTEVFLGNCWIPLDATQGKGGAGADRIKLAHSDLKGASAFGSFLPVAQVMGRIDIEVLDNEPYSKGHATQTTEE